MPEQVFNSIGPGQQGWIVPPAAAPSPRWYAVYTRSHFEKRVASELTAKGVENYLPVIQEARRWKDRTKIIDFPVFPSYVFSRFADSHRSRLEVLKTIGTVRILSRGESIDPIPDREIESLQRLLKANVRCFAHPFLREGAWVRIKCGPLKDIEGHLVRLKNDTRLVVSIALLTQSVATEIDIRDVEVIRASPSARRALH